MALTLTEGNRVANRHPGYLQVNATAQAADNHWETIHYDIPADLGKLFILAEITMHIYNAATYHAVADDYERPWMDVIRDSASIIVHQPFTDLPLSVAASGTTRNRTTYCHRPPFFFHYRPGDRISIWTPPLDNNGSATAIVDAYFRFIPEN